MRRYPPSYSPESAAVSPNLEQLVIISQESSGQFLGLDGDHAMHAEQIGRVDPGLVGLETGAVSDGLEILDAVFVGNLRVDGFALAETQALAADAHELRGQAFEVHLDPALVFVVKSLVAKAPQLEIPAELAVDAREQIEVERGGHARRVVVGGVEHLLVFFQVDADEQGTARADHAPGELQELDRLVRGEVADGRTREIHGFSPDRHADELG